MNDTSVDVDVFVGVTIVGRDSFADEELEWESPALACNSADESLTRGELRRTTSSSRIRMDLK